jgi:hypothetical protein
MQTGRDAAVIIAGVILVTVLGQPVRRIRLKAGKCATRS